MVKHIILWQLKDELSDAEKAAVKSFEALKGYAVHPAHVAVADGKVRPYTKTRVCMDYEV